jgi:hypothetical protein
MNRVLNNLISIGSFYENSTLVKARELINLSRKFHNCGSTFQTARVNEIMNCIYLVNSELKSKKQDKRYFCFVPSSDPKYTNSKPFYAGFEEIGLLSLGNI